MLRAEVDGVDLHAPEQADFAPNPHGVGDSQILTLSIGEPYSPHSNVEARFNGTGGNGDVLSKDDYDLFDSLDSDGDETLGALGVDDTGRDTGFEFNILDWHEHDNYGVDVDTTSPESKIEFYDLTAALLLATVEHFPLGWQVHHTHMDALRARYAELKIDVDKMEHLRGVHPIVHNEINNAQDAWRRALMKEMKLDPNVAGNTKKFWETVDMKKVAEFEKKIEETYGHLFLKTGATADDTKAVLKIIDGERKSRRFVAGMGKRWAALFPTVTGLAIFSFLGESTAMAGAVLADPPEAQAAWKAFETQYKGLIQKAMNGGRITFFEGQNFMTAFDNYLVAIKTPDDTRQKVVGALRTWIDANLQP
jgi:hypothetical protein